MQRELLTKRSGNPPRLRRRRLNPGQPLTGGAQIIIFIIS